MSVPLLVLGSWCALVFVQPQAPLEFASRAELEREFSRAVVAGDELRCQELLPSNEDDLLCSFSNWVEGWFEGRTDEPPELEALGRAVEARTGRRTWIELVHHVRGYGSNERSRWLGARRDRMEEFPTERPAALARAQATFRALGYQPEMMFAIFGLLELALERHEFEKAAGLAEEMGEQCRTLDMPFWEATALELRGQALAHLGRFVEADASVDRGLELKLSLRRQGFLWAAADHAAQALRFGRATRTLELAERLLAEARRAPESEEGVQWATSLARGSLITLGRGPEAAARLGPIYALPEGELAAAVRARDRERVLTQVGGDPTWLDWPFDTYLLEAARLLEQGSPATEPLGHARFLAEIMALPQFLREVEQLAEDPCPDSVDLFEGTAEIGFGATVEFWGDKELALSSFRHAYERLSPERWPRYRHHAAYRFGDCLGELGDPAAALAPLSEYRDLSAYLARPLSAETHARTLLAATFERLGDYHRSLSELDGAAAALRAVGRQPDLLMLSARASAELALGQPERALETTEAALARIGEWSSLGPTLERQCGWALAGLGRYREALPHLERSLFSYSSTEEVLVVASMSRCHLALGDTERALACARTALEKAEVQGRSSRLHQALLALGSALRERGDLDGARIHHERALALSEGIGHARDAADTLHALALDHAAAGDTERALEALEACLAHLNRVGRRFLPEDGRSQFLAQWADVPELAARLAAERVRAGDLAALARAFALADAFQAHSLREAMQERSELGLKAAQPELAAAWQRALDERISLRLKLERASEPAQREQLGQALAEKERACAELEQSLRLSRPELGRLLHPPLAELAGLQRALTGEEALLQFVLGAEASYVWVVTAERAELVTLAAREELRELQEALVSALELRQPLDRRFVAPARALYDALLAPAAPWIAGKQRWLVVPDGFLAFVPFDALLPGGRPEDALGELPFVVRDHDLMYLPSSALAQFGTSADQERGRILLLGDPAYSQAPDADLLARRALGTLDPERIQRLQRARAEVFAIAERFTGAGETEVARALAHQPRSGRLVGERFELLFGSEASRTSFVQRARDASLVHLAVHGYVDAEHPWFSGLILAGEGDETSAFLSAAQVSRLTLDADLVFLSACETARGALVRSEGVQNLVRAFMLAGARRVVATQWSVSDEAAARLAVEFYGAYTRGTSASAALRAAKLALLAGSEHVPTGLERGIGATSRAIEESPLAHPGRWAPFVLWGSGAR